MIDFELTEFDKECIEQVHKRALVARKYARKYDDQEHEFPPDELPEAKDFPGSAFAIMGKRTENDSGMAVLSMLMSAAETWGDYSVRVRRPKGGLGNTALQAAGTPEQKERWGGQTLAMAITEPGCGSDSKAVQMTAELDGDEWVINGEKIFVTTGCRCDGVIVWATIDKSAGRAGIKSFLIPRGAPGFEVTHKEKKLGIRSDDTAAMVFQNCRIPRDHLLGLNEEIPKKGAGGFKGVMKTFNMTRPAVGALGLGMAQAAIDFTREALAEEGITVDYGAGLPSRSALQQKLIELEADWDAAMLTVLHAAWMSDRGLANNMEASLAKAKAGEMSRTIPARCIDILGSLGVSQEYLVEKWLRDARITDIYEGTGEIQRLIIARHILEYGSAQLS